MIPNLPSDVPIIGEREPCKVLAAYATAVVECSCEAKSVLVLQGRGRVSRCPACETPWAIAKAGSMQIGMVVVDDGQLVTP